jgi:hypothetical protein
MNNHVRVLEVWSYDPDGRRWPPEKIAEPTSEQIETAIRGLDRGTRPILFLWASADPAFQMIDEFSERLEVSGGNGVYWVAGTFGGCFQRRLLNPAGGADEVEIYGPRIEQGFAARDRYICRDIDLVLRAALYYAERGTFDPSLSWESFIARR